MDEDVTDGLTVWETNGRYLDGVSPILEIFSLDSRDFTDIGKQYNTLMSLILLYYWGYLDELIRSLKSGFS
jgi:hypothetical protein